MRRASSGLLSIPLSVLARVGHLISRWVLDNVLLAVGFYNTPNARHWDDFYSIGHRIKKLVFLLLTTYKINQSSAHHIQNQLVIVFNLP
jgi:hypothetical protein